MNKPRIRIYHRPGMIKLRKQLYWWFWTTLGLYLPIANRNIEILIR